MEIKQNRRDLVMPSVKKGKKNFSPLGSKALSTSLLSTTY